jgi:hypothetical protein
MRKVRNAFTILVGKPDGQSSFGRPTRRQDDNIRMDCEEKLWNWVYLHKDRYQWRETVNTVMNLQVP